MPVVVAGISVGGCGIDRQHSGDSGGRKTRIAPIRLTCQLVRDNMVRVLRPWIAESSSANPMSETPADQHFKQVSDGLPESVAGGTGRDLKKLSILLPASLHLRARRYAMLTDQTLTQLVTTLLSDFLDAQEDGLRSGDGG